MKSRFDKGEGVQHFSLRKLSIGVASVLLGTSFMMYGGKTVHADSQNNNSNDGHDDTTLKTEATDKFNSDSAKNNYTTQSEAAQKNQDNSQENNHSNQTISSSDKAVKATQEDSSKSVEKTVSPKADNHQNVNSEQVKTGSASSENKEDQKNISNAKDGKQTKNDQKANEGQSLTAKGVTVNKTASAQPTYTEAQIRHAFGLDKADLSDAQLAALGIDRDTYLRNGVKYKVTGNFDAYLDNGQTFYHIPFHVTHNAMVVSIICIEMRNTR